MGAGAADDRIALRIETSADLTGVRQARAETSALGDAAKKATAEMAAGSAASTEGQRGLADAARSAAVEQGKHTLSIEQSRKAVAESGGDLEKLKTILARMVAEEQSLASATAKATSELEKQAAVPSAGPSLSRPATVLPGPNAPQLGPAVPGTPAGGGVNRSLALAEMAAYREEAERNAVSLTKIPPAARQAGNAMGLLAAAAATGNGSLSGLATAAGNVAQGMSLMTTNAKLAASAAGIGALAASIGILIGLAIEAKKKLNEMPEGKLAQAADAHIKNLHTEQQVLQQLALLDARRAALADNAGRGDEKSAQAIVDLDKQREALTERRIAIADEDRQRGLRAIAINVEAQTTAQGRYRARLQQIDAERLEAVRTHELTVSAADQRAAAQRRELARQGEEYTNGLAEAAAASRDAMVVTSYQARINAADRAAQEEVRLIKERALSADKEQAALDYIELKRRGIVALAERERDASLAMSIAQRATQQDDPRTVLAGKLALIAEEEKADRMRLGAEEAARIAAEKRRVLQRQTITEGLSGYAALSNAVKNHGTVLGAMAKAAADAVRLYEIYEKGKSAAISAQMEGAAALAAFGTGNLAGGALHLAAAAGYGAAAVAAGVEAYGVVHSGGGSGSGASVSGSGYAESGTFVPRNGEGSGAITVVLQTVDPYNREKINEVRYQLNRSGNLKRPIQLPPTTGLLGVA